MSKSRARVRVGRCALTAAVAATGAVALGAAPTAQAAPVPVPVITRYAGTSGVQADTPAAGPALSTAFDYPWALALDKTGNLYVGDCGDTVSKITPAGALTVITGTGHDGTPTPGPAAASQIECGAGLAVDPAGNIYIGDDGNHVIEKITPAGVLSIYAGTGTAGTPVPGSALASPLEDPDGLALDAAGNLYVADSRTRGIVYKITPAGQLVIVAGNGTAGYPVPGPALQSPLGATNGEYTNGPIGIAAAGDGTLYIADDANNVIEKVTPAGILSVVAGNGTQAAAVPGPATSSPLNDPEGVSVDTAGNLYIADSSNYSVEKVTPAGVLSLVTGNDSTTQTAPVYGGPAATSPIQYDESVVVSPAGVLYVADSDNYTIDRVGYAAPTTPTHLTATAGDTTATLSFTPGDPGTSPVTGYEVSLDGGRTFTALTTAAGPDGTRTAHLTGLTDGTTYPVQVRAVNASGTSPASNTAPVTPRAGIIAPGAPTAVTATPGVRSLTVRWHTPAQQGNPALTGYTVTVTDQTTRARRTVHVGRVLSATIPGLTAGHPYTATVTATSPDRTGPPSAASAPATPTAPKPAPIPAPKPSAHAPALTVVGLRAARLPVTCQVSTGTLRSCAVTLTARVNGHSVVLGRGSRTVTAATRRVTVPVVLTRAGRVLAARVGGLPATAAATVRVPGRTRPLTATTPTRVVTVVTVDPQPVYFAPASATLTPADKAELTALRHHLGGVHAVVCAGYTDTLGDNPYNTRLGLARATNTCRYLIAGTGVKAVAVSFGETHPAASNRTPAGRAANRRALVALDY